LQEEGKSITPGRVVAALTFGFWKAMLNKQYENLWQTVLHKAAWREDGKGVTRKALAEGRSRRFGSSATAWRTMSRSSTGTCPSIMKTSNADRLTLTSGGRVTALP
jgi:hypothetical protein